MAGFRLGCLLAPSFVRLGQVISSACGPDAGRIDGKQSLFQEVDGHFVLAAIQGHQAQPIACVLFGTSQQMLGDHNPL
jgi:hypothetical protein